MVAEIVQIEPYELMLCREMIPLFIPCNFIYSIPDLDVNESKLILKLDFEIFLSKSVFPSTARLWFFIHTWISLSY